VDGAAVVGRNVRRLRQERQLSLGGLARTAGLAKQTLANLESGTGNPNVETLFAVARALDVGPTWLVSEWGSPVHVQRSTEAVWEVDGPTGTRTLSRIYGSGQVHTSVLDLERDPDHGDRPAGPAVTLLHLYVLLGDVLAGPAGEAVALAEGDFIRFPGDSSHVVAASSTTARVHLVTTVPQTQQFGPA
jgi:transcriptional regulator with XRE-family HTH domain